MAIRQSYSLSRSDDSNLICLIDCTATEDINLYCKLSIECKAPIKISAPHVTIIAGSKVRLGCSFIPKTGYNPSQFEVPVCLTIVAPHLIVGAVKFLTTPSKVDLQCKKITILLYNIKDSPRIELFKKWAGAQQIELVEQWAEEPLFAT
jgi:hypothetical protein